MFFHVPDKAEPPAVVSVVPTLANILAVPDVLYLKFEPAIVPFEDTLEVVLFQAIA